MLWRLKRGRQELSREGSVEDVGIEEGLGAWKNVKLPERRPEDATTDLGKAWNGDACSIVNRL